LCRVRSPFSERLQDPNGGLILDESSIRDAFWWSSLESLMGGYHWQKYQHEGERFRPRDHLSGATDGLFQWHNDLTAFEHGPAVAKH